MDELQRILKQWLSFFFVDGRYRVYNTQSGPSFNDALVDFTSEKLSWRLANDKGQILLSCSPGQESYNERESYSIDLIIRLIDGRKIDSALLTKEISAWVGSNLDAIEYRFADEHLIQTKLEMKRLKKLRAKELFG